MPTGAETWMPFTFHLVKFSFLQASSNSQNKESQKVTVPEGGFPTESLERADLPVVFIVWLDFYKTPGISTLQEYLSVELGRIFRHMFCPLFQHKYLMSSMLQPLLSKSRKQINAPGMLPGRESLHFCLYLSFASRSLTSSCRHKCHGAQGQPHPAVT